MSNCDLVAGRSLIALAASRLALGAPALRAATALTRPNRSAQWLPCGRHGVPTAVTVGPKANPRHLSQCSFRVIQVRQASWCDPAGGSPAQVRGSARLVTSVAWPLATVVAKRTQRLHGVWD